MCLCVYCNCIGFTGFVGVAIKSYPRVAIHFTDNFVPGVAYFSGKLIFGINVIGSTSGACFECLACIYFLRVGVGSR